jgi:hypothetical protein
MNQLVQDELQFIIATHLPILMAYPDALIYQISDDGIGQIEYNDTEHYQVTKTFLANPDRMLRELFQDDQHDGINLISIYKWRGNKILFFLSEFRVGFKEFSVGLLGAEMRV